MSVLEKHGCSFCNIKFDNLKIYEIHVKLLHSKSSPKIEVQKILPPKMNKSPKIENINICKELTKSNLDENAKQSKISSFQCDICLGFYSSEGNLRQHKTTHENNRKRFQCDFCNNSYSASRDLTRHIKLDHKGQKPHSCKICSKSFKTRYRLVKHQFVHSDEKYFSCDICDAKFKIKYHLNRHSEIHERKLKHSCEFCNMLR